ncbi:MAG: hypothetical protein L0Y66_18020 [Myxococcaceae bacterium]|nr:hypothetical protein [Myxococcaceae bacterium]MCI0669623.1 hypothetical protein [Myxococcaceae bacterium]
MVRRTGSEPELKKLRERIQQWRASRRGRGMPPELWADAAAAARRLGVSYVATALGLGYAPLKARASGGPSSGAAKSTAFVEVSGAQLLTPSAAAAVRIEVVAHGEARLTITLPAASGLDVAALVNAFVRA